MNTETSTRKNKTRKTFRLNQNLLDHAQRLLKTNTETETIEKALEQVLFKTDIRKWIDRSSGRYPRL